LPGGGFRAKRDDMLGAAADSYFFSYGSLVNRATHEAVGEARHARLRGWRRMWRHTPLRPVAYLTAVPDPGTQIDGLVATVPGADWRGLDAREHAYRRVMVSGQVEHGLEGAAIVATYTIPDGMHGPANEIHPILLSYIDTVVQGYLAEFGPGGVRAFFATTSGWDAPVFDDRGAPRYRRHRPCTDAERALTDALLAGVGARIVPG